MIIISIILSLLLAIFFIPIKVDVKLSTYRLNEKNKNFGDRIKIKILYFIPIYTYKIKDVQVGKKEKEVNIVKRVLDIFITMVEKNRENKNKNKIIKMDEIGKIFKNVKAQKFILSLGINTGDYIANAYINVVVNTALCLFINFNSKKFDFNNLYYKVYTSKKLYEYDISCIFTFRVANTIVIFSKIIYRSLKERWNLKCQNNIQLKT